MMSSSQKIGILTFHRCINYCSYWQARCLVEGLRALGRDAVLLDHDSAGVNRAEWRCALQPRLPKRSSPEELRAYAEKSRRFAEAFCTLPRSKRFDLESPDALGSYDTIIVGSDEVWNLHHPWYGGRSVFTASGCRQNGSSPMRPASAITTPSVGCRIGVPTGSPASTRSRSATATAQAWSSRRWTSSPALVLDPCLQFPPAPPSGQPEPQRPYLLVYGHSFPSWFCRTVRRWAKRRGYRLLSIGYRNDWADEQRIAAGPGIFARLMADAAAVATNFFHGCVFALLNAKPFVCVPSEYRSNKVSDLACRLGAERHLLADAHARSVDGCLEEAPAPAVFARIAELRGRSAAFLAAATS